MRLVRSIAALAFLSAAVLAVQVASLADLPSVVSGTVRDDVGKPVAGARVYVFSTGAPIVSTTTDAAGFFVLFSQNYGLAEAFAERTGDAGCRSGPKPVSAAPRRRNPSYDSFVYARTHLALLCSVYGNANSEAVDVLTGR